jgi:pullulanase/glycogen debranching enzyme
MMIASAVSPGSVFPLGATPPACGVNFSVYANKAEAVELLLFISLVLIRSLPNDYDW